MRSRRNYGDCTVSLPCNKECKALLEVTKQRKVVLRPSAPQASTGPHWILRLLAALGSIYDHVIPAQAEDWLQTGHVLLDFLCTYDSATRRPLGGPDQEPYHAPLAVDSGDFSP